MKKDSSIPSFRSYENAIQKLTTEPQRKTLLTIKVGAITRLARDILAIILMWKLITIIY